MGFQQGSAFCRTCNRSTLVGRRTPSDTLHFLISVFTCALWVIPWFFISLTSGPWRCQTCGGQKLTGTPKSIVTVTLGVVALVVLLVAVLGLAGIYVAEKRNESPRDAIPVKRT